jgi:uncharacterized protein (DUF2336 family)
MPCMYAVCSGRGDAVGAKHAAAPFATLSATTSASRKLRWRAGMCEPYMCALLCELDMCAFYAIRVYLACMPHIHAL